MSIVEHWKVHVNHDAVAIVFPVAKMEVLQLLADAVNTPLPELLFEEVFSDCVGLEEARELIDERTAYTNDYLARECIRTAVFEYGDFEVEGSTKTIEEDAHEWLCNGESDEERALFLEATRAATDLKFARCRLLIAEAAALGKWEPLGKVRTT